jgi:sialate O-acetylesterase
VGLIDNSWGGSACEAWIERKLLSEDHRFRKMHQFWLQLEAAYDYDAKLAEYNEQLKTWKAGDKTTPRPYTPENMLSSKNRPANLYNGMLCPLIGYGMRGVIWYQGETNAERAYQYRELFPLMVESWRKDWQIGDFPFYWVQLADFMEEASEPGKSNWAELREAQSLALDKLAHVGQAVTIDLGETGDIHPRNKRDVALRLARLALAQDYGIDVPHISPRYDSLTVADGKVHITFETGKHPAGKLKAYDTSELIGFTIAGEDRKFVPAAAKIIADNQVEVWSNSVPQPVAVRYAWANNPVCNLKNHAGLPASPFRTDDWPGITMKSY